MCGERTSYDWEKKDYSWIYALRGVGMGDKFTLIILFKKAYEVKRGRTYKLRKGNNQFKIGVSTTGVGGQAQRRRREESGSKD